MGSMLFIVECFVVFFMFLCKLSKHLRKTHARGLIQDFLIIGLQLQMDNIPIQDRPPKYRSQNTFLTYHDDLLCGRISEKLTAYMTNHLQNNPPRQKNYLDGKQWAKRLLTFLWNQLHVVWKLRCNAQHDSNGKQQDKYVHEMATKQIRLLYEYKPRVLAFDQAKLFPQ